ncbi:MAG: hypothetical protein MRY74_13240 [Neomegalonema sp.]|nr:hypothetical protein [Neomegalonema sp.]
MMQETIEAARIEARARQYETYVRMAEAVTDRKSVLTRYYTGLNTALIGGAGFALSNFVSAERALHDRLALQICAALLFACVIGLIFCWIWRSTIARDDRWQEAKYQVIRALEDEQDAELWRLYSREWDLRGLAERTRRRPRFSLASPPYIFAAIYICAAAVAIYQSYGLAQKLGGWGAMFKLLLSS